MLRLFFFKFLSWAIALGSGTSGGTLAPLLTIGGGGGALLGAGILYLFPNCGINIPMAALIGMSSMFAGASRAYLTSITFALEATGQFHALLPLLGGCTASYIVSFFLMENTIMTEKIARRGVFTPDSYEPDLLGKLTAEQVINKESVVFSPGSSIGEVREWLKQHNTPVKYFAVADEQGNYLGTVSIANIYRHDLEPASHLMAIVEHTNVGVKSNDSLRKAVEIMSGGAEVLPVLAENKVIGVLSYPDIINAYKIDFEANEQANTQISLKRRRLKVMLRGKELFKTK